MTGSTCTETELERRLSTVIMQGSVRPAVRELPAGSVLTRQGEPGESLYLLLDGCSRSTSTANS